jgi:intracellular sulfur oxidation DsrE/DsrF family protein
MQQRKPVLVLWEVEEAPMRALHLSKPRVRRGLLRGSDSVADRQAGHGGRTEHTTQETTARGSVCCTHRSSCDAGTIDLFLPLEKCYCRHSDEVVKGQVSGMKRLLAVVFCAALTAAVMHAQSVRQPRPYKVVFDLTSDDPLDQAAVLRWLREVGAANPQTDMEVVMYGRGLALVVAERSARIDDVKAAIASPHISFKVCEIAMRNQKIEKSQLLPNVGTVPDGIGELVDKQTHGWGYIKAVH